MWTMIGTKTYKKCAQVYKLEGRIKELEAENKAVLRRAEAAEEDWQLAEAENKKLIEGQKAKTISGR